MNALHCVRRELHESIVDGFWGSLLPKALEAVTESLDERDPDMALAILRLAGRGIADSLPSSATPLAEE